MKRFVLSLLALAVLSPVAGFSQEIPLPLPLTRQEKLLTTAIMKPAINSLFTQHRPGMLGLSFVMNPMFKAGFEQEYGVTEEQSALIMVKFQEKLEGVEEMAAFGQIIGQIAERAGQDEDADSIELSEEEVYAIQAGYDRIFDSFTEIATEVFTPEQMEKICEMEFAVFGGIESSFFSIDSMRVLDLTDEQIRELEELQQDIADEKLEMIDGLSGFTTKIFKTGKINIQEAQAFDAKYKGLTNKIGSRLRDVLTEEQQKKATRLVRDQQAKILKMMGGPGVMTQWMPAIDSWVPGMPIPDSLKPKEPQRRFPTARPRPAEE